MYNFQLQLIFQMAVALFTILTAASWEALNQNHLA